MIEIVEGLAHDVSSIMPVMDKAFDPAFGEAWTASQCMAVLVMPGSQLLIARNSEGLTVGFAISRWVLDEEELLMIGVLPAWRRKDIATKLFEEIKKRADISERNKIFLEVRRENSAKVFYDKAGFVSVGNRKKYYRGIDGSLHDAVTMSLFL